MTITVQYLTEKTPAALKYEIIRIRQRFDRPQPKP